MEGNQGLKGNNRPPAPAVTSNFPPLTALQLCRVLVLIGTVSSPALEALHESAQCHLLKCHSHEKYALPSHGFLSCTSKAQCTVTVVRDLPLAKLEFFQLGMLVRA